MNKHAIQRSARALRETSSRRRLLGALAASAGAAGLVRVTGIAAMATSDTTHLVTPIAIEDVHPCTGESILLEGQIRWVFHVTTDAAGGLHLATHSNAHAAGTGADGTRYRFKDMAKSVMKLSGSAQLVEGFVLNHHVIGQGGAADFRLRERFHLTVNANGEVTATFDESESSCT
jgi:hypothetical protein